MEEAYEEQKAKWKDIYTFVLAVGELFTNSKSDDVTQRKDDPQHPRQIDILELDNAHAPIDTTEFPEVLLGKCLWGASYSAILFSFLRNLSWVECGNTEYTTYLEILLSFQFYTGVHIPTQLPNEKYKVYQSHSFDGRISKHPSINSSL